MVWAALEFGVAASPDWLLENSLFSDWSAARRYFLPEADRVRACAETRIGSKRGPNVEIDRGIEREVEMTRDEYSK